MNALTVTTKEQFLQKLTQAFNDRLAAQEASLVAEFAAHFLQHLPFEELLERRFSDVYGTVLSAWHFAQAGPGDQALVQVFNPDLEEDGWQSTHTLLFVLHRNIPFLIDSLRMAINQRELSIHSLYYTVFRPRREQGIVALDVATQHPQDPAEEALIVLEVDRHSEAAALAALHGDLEQVLYEVRTAVSDFPVMRERALAILEELQTPPGKLDQGDMEEARAFIQWLTSDHFTFLGYDEYDFVRRKSDIEVRQVKGSDLGILRLHNERQHAVRLNQLPVQTREAMTRNDDLFIFAKSSQRSRVHRPAYPDYIAIKKFNDKGEVVGERRFLGLYTARVYNERPDEIPLLRAKVNTVLEQSGFPREDYAGKELDQILTVYPRDQLFQMNSRELLQVATAILYIQERRHIRLFMREDVYGEFVTCLVFVPRELYNTELRQDMEEAISNMLGAQGIEFTTYFSESVLARTQFTVRVTPENNRSLPQAELQSKLIALAQSWREGLLAGLVENHGEEQGSRLAQRYQSAFPAGFRDQFSPRRAAIDVDYLERAVNQAELAMSFYRDPGEGDDMLHFKIFHPHQQLTLSDIIPIFENLGFRVIGENPFETVNREGLRVWIHDFSLRTSQGQPVDIHRIRPLFESLFQRIWSGEAENDIFNRLVLAAYLDWRQIAVLRAYGRYMQQIRISNSQNFIAATLVSHVELAALLLAFFDARFNPARYQSEQQCQAVQQKLEIEFNAGLDQVLNLSEDRVLRLFLSLMQASTRTNYYQRDQQGQAKPYISFKLRPGLIHDMPKPRPMYEIFVYSPQVEGVHLRGGKVARGGLRWSDRFEDYRTEVLGLVKAQQVKNAVIVPVGAKGGFVAKQLPEHGDREALQKAGIEAYITFIRGLLDITDNYPGGVIVPPKEVLRHDEDDYYLVVAADKGTATFSDIANGIAAEYDFWLGDAFASGGSQGYDHKKMGITARGAWVAVERHFREMGLNTAKEDFSVVAIGDMGGDVFGNGMLCSEHIRLQAAFNHVHIFIDPDPDPAASYRERQRLFAGPASSWEDYDAKLISKGGGVFSRSAKSIVLSAEMKQFLGTNSDSMPPNMLIGQILRARVDLLWIGGIGTFVKSTRESHSDVGDKANDSLRVDAPELGCRVIGEGGNLGMSQRARIEYSLQGGRCNTDFIDNAGGVDCSDHEVNIKILLNRLVAEGDMTLKQRNQMLAAMTDDVSRLVLCNMYRQTQAISIANREAAGRLEEYRRLMNRYEAAGILDRQLEFLPDDDALNERQLAGQGLTRPELSILASYVKADLKQTLNASSLPDDPSLGRVLQRVFPGSLVERFGEQLAAHQLHREIIATEIANDMVNTMGITFVERLQLSTGAPVAAIAQAYLIASAVFELPQWWYRVEELDYAIDSDLQMLLMADLMRLVRRGAHWLLRNRRSEMNVQEHCGYFAGHVTTIANNLPAHLGVAAEAQWRSAYEALAEQGVPEHLAGIVAASGHLYAALGIIEVREETGRPLQEVTQLFYAIGEALDLDWLALAISRLKPRSHWQAMARESFREDLSWQQRALTTAVLGQQQEGESISECLARWQAQHPVLMERWNGMLGELRSQSEPEFPMFSVALRELLDLAQSSQHVGLAGR